MINQLFVTCVGVALMVLKMGEFDILPGVKVISIYHGCSGGGGTIHDIIIYYECLVCVRTVKLYCHFIMSTRVTAVIHILVWQLNVYKICGYRYNGYIVRLHQA